MFNPAIFDTSSLMNWNVIYDKNGTIDFGNWSVDPINYGFTPLYTIGWVASGLLNGGYTIDYNAMVAKYEDSTFFSAVNHVISSPSGTTYQIDNGIEGTSGSDFITDMSGDNIVSANEGDDFVLLSGGNDAVSGGAGNDEIYTSGGNDIVDGGSGNDSIYLYDGNDQARGGDDADMIFGEAGKDKIWGERGNDIVDGGLGNDKLRGGQGHDEVFGGEGNDKLWGYGGHDRLHGGDGNDVMFGGGGRDTFVFNFGDDNDKIRDFDAARDTLELDLALGVSDMNELSQKYTEVNGDLIFDFGNGDTLTLEDTSWADLAGANIDFL